MENEIRGIHHVTAIAGDPQRNLDFYTQVLGLRLVKQTVNYDDLGTYHFYFGDELGRPGTILTFFPWPGGPRGTRGVGQATVTSFSVPPGTLEFWRERLSALGVLVEDPEARFGERVLALRDPDGLTLELVAHEGAGEIEPWLDGPLPADVALRGLHGVTLREREAAPTARFLTEVLGLKVVGEWGGRSRFGAASGAPGRFVDVVADPEGSVGRTAAGTVHHVAWRVANEGVQLEWREELVDRGWHVSPVMDRQYFRSIYFREPGGVLFEIATDLPGFTRDEAPAGLGSALRLPDWLETEREAVEAALPEIVLPRVLIGGESR